MIVALLTFTFTWIRLPETKGRTFDDIAEEFRGAEGIPLHNKTVFNTFTWATRQFWLMLVNNQCVSQFNLKQQKICYKTVLNINLVLTALKIDF